MQQQSINPAQIEMAETELSMISDIFDRLVRSCHTKCISEVYKEGELNKGEGVCVDRCVAAAALPALHLPPPGLLLGLLLAELRARDGPHASSLSRQDADGLPPPFLLPPHHSLVSNPAYRGRAPPSRPPPSQPFLRALSPLTLPTPLTSRVLSLRTRGASFGF